jgi:alpha-galactosidase
MKHPKKSYLLFGLFLLVGLFLCSLSSFAANAVRFLPDKKVWILETQRTSYVVGINELNAVQNLFWGGKIQRDQDFDVARTWDDYSFENREGMTPEEYPGWGGMRFNEPCLKVTFNDGGRDLILKYVSHQSEPNQLVIKLKDIQKEIFINLKYRVYPAYDLILKQTEIENKTNQAVLLESAQSGVWYVPFGEGYRLSYLSGRWAGETQLIREVVHPGKKVLESRRGNTSHQANPWFALDYQGKADEDHGRVWFGALGWSGNWKLAVEETANQQVRVTGGYNDFDFGYLLKPGEKLETPAFAGGYTDQGFGEASRLLHRFEREEVAPDHAAPHPRPVLYNSWEATTFDVNEAGQKLLAEKAAKIGIELFVMDDGWFGARNDDHAGLGDWVVNPQKFPSGLKRLIDAVNGLGMKFGLWVEPEMVNPNSDLYRKHPDWAINFPGRPRTEGRNQLILNMARQDVKEHIFSVLDRLLAENPNIVFLKWDMNRHITEPGWPEMPKDEQKKIYVQYVNNVYEVFSHLRSKYPKLEIESCSGGGGRVDLGILSRVDEVWTSDNTEAFDRLKIQEGFSFGYAPQFMMSWVTDVPNMNGRSTSLKYRFLVAMQGSLGIGSNLNHWKGEDFALAAQMISIYKQIRSSVQLGRLYRLFSPREGDLTANQYVSEDGKQAVLFAFRQAQQLNRLLPPLCLKGLDPAANYRIQKIDDKLVETQPVLSGSFLMNHGLNLKLSGDFDCTMLIFEKVN